MTTFLSMPSATPQTSARSTTPTPTSPLPSLSATALLGRLQRLCSLLQCRPDLLSSQTPLQDDITSHLFVLERFLDAPISQSKEPDGSSLFDDDTSDDESSDEGIDDQPLILPSQPSTTLQSGIELSSSPKPPVDSVVIPRSAPISPPLSSRSVVGSSSSGSHDDDCGLIGPQQSQIMEVSANSYQTVVSLSTLDPLLSRLMDASARLKSNYDSVVALNDSLIARMDQFSNDSMQQQTDSDRLKHTVQFQRTELLCLKMQLECYANGFGERAGIEPLSPFLVRAMSTTDGNSSSRSGLKVPSITTSKPTSAATSPVLASLSPSADCFKSHGASSSVASGTHNIATRTPSEGTEHGLVATAFKPLSSDREPTVGDQRGWSYPHNHRREGVQSYINRNTPSGESHLAATIKPGSSFLSRRTASVDHPNFPYLEMVGPSTLLGLTSSSDETEGSAPDEPTSVSLDLSIEHEERPSRRRSTMVSGNPSNQILSRHRVPLGLIDTIDEDAINRELEDDVNRADIESHTSDVEINSAQENILSHHHRSESSDWWANHTPCPANKQRRIISSGSPTSPSTPMPKRPYRATSDYNIIDLHRNPRSRTMDANSMESIFPVNDLDPEVGYSIHQNHFEIRDSLNVEPNIYQGGSSPPQVPSEYSSHQESAVELAGLQSSPLGEWSESYSRTNEADNIASDAGPVVSVFQSRHSRSETMFEHTVSFPAGHAHETNQPHMNIEADQLDSNQDHNVDADNSFPPYDYDYPTSPPMDEGALSGGDEDEFALPVPTWDSTGLNQDEYSDEDGSDESYETDNDNDGSTRDGEISQHTALRAARGGDAPPSTPFRDFIGSWIELSGMGSDY